MNLEGILTPYEFLRITLFRPIPMYEKIAQKLLTDKEDVSCENTKE